MLSFNVKGSYDVLFNNFLNKTYDKEIIEYFKEILKTSERESLLSCSDLLEFVDFTLDPGKDINFIFVDYNFKDKKIKCIINGYLYYLRDKAFYSLVE